MAKNYLYMLARVVYCVRVLGIKTLLLATNYKRQTDANYKYFLEIRKKFLANSLYSLISKILSLLVYRKKVVLSIGNIGNLY